MILNDCKDNCLALNTDRTKNTIHRGMMANEHMIGSNSYEKVKTFKYLGSLLTNQNSIQEEIKSRLKAGNSCYYLLQTFLSFRLLSLNLKIEIYKTIILPVVLYGCEAWPSTLREERRLRAFENKILRRIFGSGKGFTMRNLIVCTVRLLQSV